MGRYWAQLEGKGNAKGGTVWFEYQPADAASWEEGQATPSRDVEPGADLGTP